LKRKRNVACSWGASVVRLEDQSTLSDGRPPSRPPCTSTLPSSSAPPGSALSSACLAGLPALASAQTQSLCEPRLREREEAAGSVEGDLLRVDAPTPSTEVLSDQLSRLRQQCAAPGPKAAPNSEAASDFDEIQDALWRVTGEARGRTDTNVGNTSNAEDTAAGRTPQ